MLIRYKTPQGMPAEYSGVVIAVMEDLSTQKPGYFRAFYMDDVADETSVTLHGYASAIGSFRTVKATTADARKRDTMSPIYRVYRDGRKPRLLSFSEAGV